MITTTKICVCNILKLVKEKLCGYLQQKSPSFSTTIMISYNKKFMCFQHCGRHHKKNRETHRLVATSGKSCNIPHMLSQQKSDEDCYTIKILCNIDRNFAYISWKLGQMVRLLLSTKKGPIWAVALGRLLGVTYEISPSRSPWMKRFPLLFLPMTK